MAILGPTAVQQMIRDADAEWEAENGMFVGNVAMEDREPSLEVSIFDDIPLPIDPYGCANPVSQEDGS
jgi:hypothetical protein